MAPYSVLIVGGGNIAGGFDNARSDDAMPLTHAGAFSRNPRFRIDACIEPDTLRATAFAARWGIGRHYSSFADLSSASSGAFDVVSICSPTSSHASDIASALTLNPRLIFCEKPITTDLAEARRCVSDCEQAGVVLMVNHTRRWAPDLRRLLDEIQAGEWGKVRSASGVYNKGILNNGSHMLDLLAYMFGALQPSWAGDPVWDHWPDDPTIPAALYGSQGFPILLNVADARDYAMFELEVVTECGVIRMEQGGNSWRIRRSVDSATFSGYKTLESSGNDVGQYDVAMKIAVEEIDVALSKGTLPASTGRTALAAQELCDRIRRLSAKTG